MASGEDVNYSRCSICLENRRNRVARRYCVDCKTYFCIECVKCHKLPSLKSHQVNDVNTSDSIDVDDEATSIQSKVQYESSSGLRCTLHGDKLMNTYCKDHNEVCCRACELDKHRSCTTVLITSAAEDFKSSPDMTTFKEALTANLVQCKQEKQKRGDTLDSIGKQKVELIEDVDKYEEEIIARIKALADISRKEIRSIYEEHKAVLDTDIKALDVVIDKLEVADDEHFIDAKTVIKEGETILQALAKDCNEREILFCLDEMLKRQVFGMKSLGQLERKEDEYRATFQSNVNLKQSNDSDFSVFDTCFTYANDLLLTDYHNKKLKRLTSNLQFNDEVELGGYPVAVCEIDKNEVAVRIWSTKVVQFVSVGQSMQLTSTFTLADNGYGMTYDAGTGEIFACEESKVSVYSKTGNKLRTYDTVTHGEQIFSHSRQIALSVNRQDIYVTDMSEGLIVLDKSGTLKLKVSLSGVSATSSLCLLPGGICLAGDFSSSGVIVQVGKDGKQVGTLIDSKDGRTNALCALYDPKLSRLIVGGYPGMISVYTLCARYK